MKNLDNMTILEKLNEIDRMQQLQADWNKSLVLIRALKAGEVTLDEVTLTENGWEVTPQKAIDIPPVIAERNGMVPVIEE